VKKDINKRTSHSVGLKNVSLLECGRGDEVATASRILAEPRESFTSCRPEHWCGRPDSSLGVSDLPLFTLQNKTTGEIKPRTDLSGMLCSIDNRCNPKDAVRRNNHPPPNAAGWGTRYDLWEHAGPFFLRLRLSVSGRSSAGRMPAGQPPGRRDSCMRPLHAADLVTAEKSSSPWPSAMACWNTDRAALAVRRETSFAAAVSMA